MSAQHRATDGLLTQPLAVYLWCGMPYSLYVTSSAAPHFVGGECDVDMWLLNRVLGELACHRTGRQATSPLPPPELFELNMKFEECR